MQTSSLKHKSGALASFQPPAGQDHHVLADSSKIGPLSVCQLHLCPIKVPLGSPKPETITRVSNKTAVPRFLRGFLARGVTLDQEF